ncbi:PKD domain-containing protein [Actinophytocola algeriensis]|uniref:PKD domain-containing protein n=1 Tax=Actinophytocola algeriensis TaxID=1768010 RepID=A0A7W7VDA3_9PSEU|nr:PKD domain-containing protein [Actinophytocola algeriensis]MBB4905775.1 hypothetical protein [Actinophytocola algeriensis]MBE1472540.1 hypothetical protein [Actinophytocola algeriensis]
MRAGLALVVAVSTSAALLIAPPAHAQAETLHVNQITGCSDSGPGSATTPYCTLQAAADVVEPGQTIKVGQVQQAAVFTRSGTEDAPITITGGEVTVPSGPRDALITLDHVEHVVLHDLRTSPGYHDPAVLVDGGSHVTIDRLRARGHGGHGVRITDATDVVVSRSWLDGEGRPVQVSGGARVTVTGNVMERYRNLGVLVESTTDAAITGNTIDGACGAALAITGATTVSVQNNVVSAPCSRRAIEVDAAAVPGTTLDYNIVDGWPPYRWGDDYYLSPAELYAATGQGAHDSDVHPDDGDAEVDSGNADAPGVIDPAFDGPRVDDPRVANTGSGAYPYLDRGAREAQDRFVRWSVSVSATRAPVGGEVAVTSDVTSDWGFPVTCTIDFGDGTTAQACSAPHTFSAPGTYTVAFQATTPSKLVLDRQWQVTVVPAGGAMTPTVTADPYGAVSALLSVDLGPDHPWSPKSVRFDVGDGNPSWTFGDTLGTTRRFDRPGTYTVTATITDVAGNVATTKPITFTTYGSGFVSYGPARFLDTRTGGTARKVGPNGTVRLAVGGQRGIPADATAVIVNVTATNPSSSGFVTTYPDGATRPVVSTLNYTAGRTVSNPATVALGTGGHLNLYNGSGGTVDLVADVLGYYVRNGSADAMNQLWPQRVLDTRTGHGQEAGVPAVIPAGGTVSPVVATASPSDLAPGEATSVLLNVTVVNPAASGFVTAYPAGTARPTASNVNFAAGETIGKAVTVPVGQDGRVSFYAHARTNLIVTILGYYIPGGDGYFVPVRPERAVDTRTSGTPIAPRADVTHPLDGNAPPPRFGVTPRSVVSNVTVVNARGSGYLIAYALAGAAESTLNFTPAGGPVSNMALTGGSNGTFHNGSDGTADLLVDVSGYFFAA